MVMLRVDHKFLLYERKSMRYFQVRSLTNVEKRIHGGKEKCTNVLIIISITSVTYSDNLKNIQNTAKYKQIRHKRPNRVQPIKLNTDLN